ncbi:hypothetical protein FRC19_011482 [Serendipita sp. 401]|nr:hypothetical protein FRC19_011482 [Serendipita sp. 401]
MLTRLPPEILQRIVILACPLISLSTVNTTPSPQNFQDQQQKSYRLQQQNATKMKNAAATGDDEKVDEKEERKAQNTGEGNEQEEEEGVQCVEEDEQDPSVSSKLGTTPFISPNFDTSPPAIVYSLSLTCRRLHELVRYGDGNAWLYSRIFERSFDFGAARRRLGPEWAGPHGIAWEGRKRWGVMKRMKRAIRIWERDGYRSTTWLKYYSESDVLQDLWALYFMLLENDGKNAVVLMLGAHLGVFVQMLCTVFFGKAVTKQPGWPLECPERALLVWVIWAVDPSRMSPIFSVSFHP